MAGDQLECTFLVVGGGIAGVSCIEELLCNGETREIILISSSPLIKVVKDYQRLTKTLESFRVEEDHHERVFGNSRNVLVIYDKAISLNYEAHVVGTHQGFTIRYCKLCLCTGASPKVILEHHPLVLGIRDTHSVSYFTSKLSSARRICVVGNGGIALELVYEVSDCEVVWVIKDHSIGNVFLDQAAAVFLLPNLALADTKDHHSSRKCARDVVKYQQYSIEVHENIKTNISGSALGPDWSASLSLHGTRPDGGTRTVSIESRVEVDAILGPEDLASLSCFPGTDQENWPVYVRLSSGKVFGCDLIVSATGVVPNGTLDTVLPEALERNVDGAVLVDVNLRTSVSDVYAAGDACELRGHTSPHWFQMRLWCQARQMGAFAAHTMRAHLAGEVLPLDFSFELFAHTTSFFGYKVCLLGLFNAQGLSSDDTVLYVRCSRGAEYVKLVVHRDRVVGAMLIGETDLEETVENLILNETDISCLGESILDPNVDIEDYFD